MAKKTKKITSYNFEDPEPSRVEESMAEYKTEAPQALNFSHKKFERLGKTIPFTLKEWANILDLSERTLHRYAHDNKSFEGIYSDRLVHIEQLIAEGLETFDSGEALYAWLKKDKTVLGRPLTFADLYTTRGIQETINQLLRIQQGVYT